MARCTLLHAAAALLLVCLAAAGHGDGWCAKPRAYRRRLGSLLSWVYCESTPRAIAATHMSALLLFLLLCTCTTPMAAVPA